MVLEKHRSGRTNADRYVERLVLDVRLPLELRVTSTSKRIGDHFECDIHTRWTPKTVNLARTALELLSTIAHSKKGNTTMCNTKGKVGTKGSKGGRKGKGK